MTANQTIDSAKLEIELIGKNIYQQTELRANLQARQQLEQEASQKRTKFDSDQYEALKKINAEYAKQAQMNAIAQTNADIKFGMNTSILSPEDVAIATQLKNIYPDVATALDSVQASGLRASRAMRDISSVVSGQLTTGLADIFDGTKSVKDGFASMSKVVIRAIEEMIIKLLIVGPLMRGLQSAAGGLFGGGGGGGIGNPTQIGSLYHSGGIVGEPTAMRSVDSSLFNFAPRLHGGLMPDEFPAILQKGEGVISRGDMAKGGSRPMVMNDNRVINIGQGASLETVEQLKKVLAEDRSQFANNVVKVVKIAQSGGHFR